MCLAGKSVLVILPPHEQSIRTSQDQWSVMLILKEWSRPAAPATGGILSEMQGLRPHSRHLSQIYVLMRPTFEQDLYEL